jgi:hypothetical protein
VCSADSLFYAFDQLLFTSLQQCFVEDSPAHEQKQTVLLPPILLPSVFSFSPSFSLGLLRNIGKTQIFLITAVINISIRNGGSTTLNCAQLTFLKRNVISYF